MTFGPPSNFTQQQLADRIDDRLKGLGLPRHVIDKMAEEALKNNPFNPPVGCPINNLPNEILAYIFHVGTFMDDEEDEEVGEEEAVRSWGGVEYDEEEFATESDSSVGSRGDEPESAELPFQVLVSHVCKHWREVAIDSPELWNFITFSEGPPFSRSKIWIERSKGQTLNIDIDCTRPKDGNPDSDMIEDQEPEPFFSESDFSTILDVIIPHVDRWRSLEVMVNLYPYIHTLLGRLAECESAPFLELLQLYHYEDGDDFDEFQPPHLAQGLVLFHNNAPKLEHVALWGVHLAWSETSILSGLRELELAYQPKNVRPSWADFARILEQSPDINTLTLCLSGPAGLPTEWPTDIIELPSLKNLVLAYHEPEYICALLQLISVPNVTSLALDFDDSDYSSLAHQLATAAPGKKKSLLAGLENLKISGLPCKTDAIHQIYGQLVNLQSLNLNCSFLEDAFFDILTKPIPNSSTTQTTSTSLYCPNLVAITTNGIDGKTMRNFVEARRAAGAPIKKVFMSEEDQISERDEEWLTKHTETFKFFEPSDSEDEVEVLELDDDAMEDEE